VSGLDAGAVDYLTKPFSLTELAARIRAQLRVASQVPQTTLRGGDVEVNLLTREVRRGGELVRLSTTEFELLVYLLRNGGRVLTREQILRAVWGYEYDPGTNVVDVYVGYLRRKLRRGEGKVPIVTVRSVGYRFDAQD
jgi:two-component system OmpR family response regulator